MPHGFLPGRLPAADRFWVAVGLTTRAEVHVNMAIEVDWRRP